MFARLLPVHKVKELNKEYQKTKIFDIIDGLKLIMLAGELLIHENFIFKKV